MDRHTGRAATKKSQSTMMIKKAMVAERPQPGLPLELSTPDPSVRKALLAMQQSLDTPLTVSALAEKLAISRRKLERYFTLALNLTLSEAGKRIRLAHAELLLKRSTRTVTQIALDCGLVDASHLIRTLRGLRGTTSKVWRKAKTLA